MARINIFGLIFMSCTLLLTQCAPERKISAEVASQRTKWEALGWTYVEACGDTRWPTETIDVTTQDSAAEFTVYANSSGIDGRDPKEEYVKVFAEPGFTFMAVNVRTGMLDSYAIVFKRKAATVAPPSGPSPTP